MNRMENDIEQIARYIYQIEIYKIEPGLSQNKFIF